VVGAFLLLPEEYEIFVVFPNMHKYLKKNATKKITKTDFM